MPLLLVKGMRYGLGMASEAVHALNDRSNATQDPKTATDNDESELSSDDIHLENCACDNYLGGKHGHGCENNATTAGETLPEPVDIEPRLPAHNAHHAAIAYQDATTEEEKVKEREAMTRQLVGMAGPPQPQLMSNQHPLACPVIIPQRRAKQRNRGFAPAYAPCLNDCGISEQTFLQFIQHLNTVNRCDGWLEAVFVAAQVVGALPFPVASIVGAVTAVVAGTAKEFQMRHRKNSFLDLANRELFMPRGLCAMLMTFKDDYRGQGMGVLGQLFSKQLMNGDDDLAQTSNPIEITSQSMEAAINRASDSPRESKMSKTWKNWSQLSSGKTRGSLELPESAALVYPQPASATAGGQQGSRQLIDRIRSVNGWVEEYQDKRSNAFYEAEHPDSKLVKPATDQKPLKSRFNDPNHPANSGSLISLVTGGAIAVPGVDTLVGQGRRMAVNLVQGKKPTENGEPIDGPAMTVFKKLIEQDVLYLMVVNLPTEQELQDATAHLAGLMKEQDTVTNSVDEAT